MQEVKEKLDIDDIEGYGGQWTWLHITTRGCFVSDRRFNTKTDAEAELERWGYWVEHGKREGIGRAIDGRGNTVFRSVEWINTIVYPVRD